MRRVMHVAFMATVAGAIVTFYYIGHRGMMRVQAQAAISVTPFAAEQVTVSYRQNPAGAITEQRTTARRSDGSQAMMSTHPDWPGSPPIRRVDFMDGRQGTFADWLKVKMTGYNSAKAIAAKKAYLKKPPQDACLRGIFRKNYKGVRPCSAWGYSRPSGP